MLRAITRWYQRRTPRFHGVVVGVGIVIFFAGAFSAYGTNRPPAGDPFQMGMFAYTFVLILYLMGLALSGGSKTRPKQ